MAGFATEETIQVLYMNRGPLEIPVEQFSLDTILPVKPDSANVDKVPIFLTGQDRPCAMMQWPGLQNHHEITAEETYRPEVQYPCKKGTSTSPCSILVDPGSGIRSMGVDPAAAGRLSCAASSFSRGKHRCSGPRSSLYSICTCYIPAAYRPAARTKKRVAPFHLGKLLSPQNRYTQVERSTRDQAVCALAGSLKSHTTGRAAMSSFLANSRRPSKQAGKAGFKRRGLSNHGSDFSLKGKSRSWTRRFLDVAKFNPPISSSHDLDRHPLNNPILDGVCL